MAAVETLITDHLDLWTAALKRKSTAGRGSSSKVELYGIKKLRELILELAVRGLLVPQDPNNEPASELLKKIAAKKARLVEEGKIKKDKPLPPITAGEAPFAIPAGWALARLADVINVLNGRAYKKHEMLSEGTPILRVGNLFTSNEWYFSDLELEPEKYIDDGDLIYAWSASFGPFIWQGGKVIYHYHIWKMDFFSKADVDKYYFRHYLQAISAAIKESGNGIAMIHMTKERMEKLVLPIPPIEEQHRIVAKVDELMALCDQLEQQTDASLGAHQTLVETLLSALTSAADHAQFASAWQRIAGHFDTLFATEESIAQLKQTILQLAVMGKLVPQDPNDEPASELLKKIAAEKAKLVKEGKIKKDKPLSVVVDSEKAYKLPMTWKWTRFGNIAFQITDGAHHTPTYVDSGVPFLSVKDVSDGQLDFSDTRCISAEQHAELAKRCHPQRGDLLLTKIGTTGVPVLIDVDSEFSIFVSVALIKFPQDLIYGPYLVHLIKSRLVKKQSEDGTEGVGNKNLVLRKIAGFVLAIPPLSEQHRIVAKVDELMALCEQLKSRLRDAQTTQLHLADALVEQAIC